MKKTTLISVFMVCAASFALFSCKSDNNNSSTVAETTDGQQKTLDIKLLPFEYDMVFESTDKSLANTPAQYLRLKGSGVLPEKLGDTNVISLRDSLLSHSSIQLGKDGNVTPVLGEEENSYSPIKINPESIDSYIYQTSTISLSLLTPQVAVFETDWNWYGGGAHGMYGSIFTNFSLSSGKVLSLSDILDLTPDNEKAIKSLIIESLPTDIQYLQDPQNVPLPENFKLGTNTITFIYPLYEIAPYAYGELKPTIYISQAEEMLKPEAKKLFVHDLY